MTTHHPTPTENPSCILVVDDQPANIQVVGSVLGALGYEIVPAVDGATALKRLNTRVPDLVLLDLLMPSMDGFEVCRRLREHPAGKDVPVIFLSAADDKEMIVRALESGGVDYLTKPFNQAELVTRVKTQLALKSARDRLRQLAEDKDELLGILAHDLKNHLGGMEMSVQLLRDRVQKLEDAKITLLAENILRSNSQLLTFVKEFLANSAADHGLTLKPVRVNLGQATVLVIDQYREAARRKELEIRTTLPEGGLDVLADNEALDQVLDNLLSNAVKFSPSGKQITVTVQAEKEFVLWVIQDQGPGFTAEDLSRLFRRYTRLSARPTGGEPSTGLGLSIVRKLVLDMGGQITCESNPGTGAAFLLQLPRFTQNKE